MFDVLTRIYRKFFPAATPAFDDETEALDTDDEAVREAIGDELRAFRLARGWSPIRAAREMNVDLMYFEGVELGIILPSPSERYPYLRLLGVSRDAFERAVKKRAGVS